MFDIFKYGFGKTIDTLRNRFSTKVKLLGLLSFQALNIGCKLSFPFLIVKGFYDLTSDINDNELSPLESDAMYYLVGAGATWVGGKFLPVLNNILANSIKNDCSVDISTDIIKKYTQLPLDYHSTNPAGQIVQLITHGFQTQDASRLMMSDIAPLLLESVGTDIIVSVIDWPIGVALIGTQFLNLMMTYFSSKPLAKYHKDYFAKGLQTQSKVLKVLGDYENMHLFQRVDAEINESNAAFQEYANSKSTMENYPEWQTLAQIIYTNLVLIGLVVLATFRYSEDEISAESLYLILIYLLQLSIPFETFSKSYGKFITSVEGLSKLNEFSNKEITIRNPLRPINLDLSSDKITIEFKNVSFSASNGEKILNNVSFRVDPQSKIALVGLSGAGKSIITKLLLRFFEPTHGKIEINGIDIKKIRLETLRKIIGIVPQQPKMSGSTVKEILQYSKSDITEDEIFNVLNDVSLAEWANSDSITKDVGNDGVRLSGGQRQRLAVARTLIKQPLIYVFDEATAALDTETSRQVQSLLDQTSNGFTALTISHDVLSVATASRIFIIENGEIIEEGTFHELCNDQNSRLYSLVNSFCEQHSLNTVSTIMNITGNNFLGEEAFYPIRYYKDTMSSNKSEILIDIVSSPNERTHLYKSINS